MVDGWRSFLTLGLLLPFIAWGRHRRAVAAADLGARRCRVRIPLRYPLVEAAAAVLAAVAVHRWGLSPASVEVVVFSWVSLALAMIDAEHQLLPDVMTYPALAFALAMSWAGGVVGLRDALLGALVGAARPVTVILVYRLWRGEEGMGWGDVKYLAAIGAVVGPYGCLWVVVAAALAGALLGVALILLGRGSGKTALPFGTFLAAAVVVYLYVPPAWLPYSGPA